MPPSCHDACSRLSTIPRPLAGRTSAEEHRHGYWALGGANRHLRRQQSPQSCEGDVLPAKLVSACTSREETERDGGEAGEDYGQLLRRLEAKHRADVILNPRERSSRRPGSKEHHADRERLLVVPPLKGHVRDRLPERLILVIWRRPCRLCVGLDRFVFSSLGRGHAALGLPSGGRPARKRTAANLGVLYYIVWGGDLTGDVEELLGAAEGGRYQHLRKLRALLPELPEQGA
eukprot:scaffold69255_cov66-Phaeocystis_antarctica.AAC.6